jgi:hypothetical protein
MSGTDWAWCFENPKDAAATIDRLQRETEELRDAMSKVIGMLKNRGDFIVSDEMIAAIAIKILQESIMSHWEHGS